jgi:ectoine hydroxylase-related dioxygenase (phytanoyl-CoA dioxygenase family)
MPITQQHHDQLLKHGYAIVPDFLPADELTAAGENFSRYFPSFEELHATPERFGFIHEDPEHLQVEFPFAGDALNAVSTHSGIIAFVEKLLGTPNILLSQSAIWAKYAGTGDFEQGLHLDYQGNTLVVPREDGDYRQVNFILYYSDVTLELGPTYVVSQQVTADLPTWPTHRTRRKHPELYKLEKPVLANAGDLLIFGMNTWHRASNILADEGARFSHHMVYRSANHGFQGYHHWPKLGENELLQQFVTKASPRQREVLGFPRMDDPYWNEQTRSAVRLRYPGIDLG